MADDDQRVTSRTFEPGAPVVPDEYDSSDLMTDDERKYLDPNYEDTKEDESAPPAAEEAKDDQTPAEPDDDGEDPAQQDDDTERQQAEADAQKTEEGATPDPEPTPDAARDWSIPDPAQYEAAISDREKQLQKVRDDFEDGELTEAERDERMQTLNAEIRQAQKDQAKAELRFDDWMEAHTQAVQKYSTEYPDLVSADGGHRDVFDQYVRRVNSDSRPIVQRMNPYERLQYAHKLYALDGEATGQNVPPLKGQRKAKEDPAPDPKQAERDRLTSDKAKKDAGTAPNPPKTIADVPSAAITETSDRFAEIDRLQGDPEAYEDALNRMTPAERDAYLAQE